MTNDMNSIRTSYRRTPEEQDAAYTLKSQVLTRIECQNEALTSELKVHRDLNAARKKFNIENDHRGRRTNRRPMTAGNLKHTNVVDEFSPRNPGSIPSGQLSRITGTTIDENDFRTKIQEIEQRHIEELNIIRVELTNARCDAKRFKKDFEILKQQKQYNDLATAQLVSHNASRQATGNRSPAPSTCTSGTHQVPSRPHTAMAGSSTRTLDRAREVRRPATARSRVSEVSSANALDRVMRQNEIFINQNKALQLEVKNLKDENSRLLKSSFHALSQKSHLMSSLGANELLRKDLSSRLHHMSKHCAELTKNLNCKAWAKCQNYKSKRIEKESGHFSMIEMESLSGAEQRTFSHFVKKNTDNPRSTFPVEFYDKPENAH